MHRLIFATALAGMFVWPLLAQESDDAAKAEAQTKAASQIKLADKDSDGRLTLAELRAARKKFQLEMIESRQDDEKSKAVRNANKLMLGWQDFLAADVNNDRVLTSSEQVDYLLSESDNKRWRLSDSDLELCAQEVWVENWNWSIAETDKDGDGHISKSEGADKLKAEKDRNEFDAADLDKDGMLSQYEYLKVGIERFKEKAKPKVEKARAEFKDVVANDDPFALYKKKGRTWMYKSATEMENMDPMITYMKYEVTEVTETGATFKVFIYDKDKKPMAGMEEGTESKIEFRKPEFPGGEQPPQPEGSGVEDGGILEAAGRKWATQKTTTKSGGNENVIWMATEMPGLIIKAEFGGKGYSTTMTLEEFSDGE